MFIDGKRYDTNLTDINTLRQVLISDIYPNTHFYYDFFSRIPNVIDVASGEFDGSVDISQSSYTFRVRVTSMRRRYKGFIHQSLFYSSILAYEFASVIYSYRDQILDSLTPRWGEETEERFDSLLKNETILSALFQVNCMTNNMLTISL